MGARAELIAFAAAWRAETAGAAAAPWRHRPAAGLAIGGVGALALWAAAHAWPAAVAVGLALALPALLTRARHEAALERALGTVALVAVLGLKAAALHGLAVRDIGAAFAALPLAHGGSRVAMAWAAAPDRRVEPQADAVIAVWALVAAALALVLGVDATALAVATVAGAATALALRRGLADAAAPGAVQQGVELAVLLALLAQRG